MIEQVCNENDREIEDDHYGVLIPYSFGTIPERLRAILAQRRPDLDDVTELVPSSWDQLTALIGQFVDVGTSKFVVLPVNEPDGAEAWAQHLTEAADVLLPLETG